MFVVVELQKYAEDNMSYLVTTHPTLNEAESKFHQVLSYAAVSSVLLHSCVLMNEDGYTFKVESYSHEPEAIAESEISE